MTRGRGGNGAEVSVNRHISFGTNLSMAKLKMTLFFMENIIDAEIEVLENENYDLGKNVLHMWWI